MDPGSSIERAVNFTAKEAQQFLQVLWGKEGRVISAGEALIPHALFLFCIFSLDLDRFL